MDLGSLVLSHLTDASVRSLGLALVAVLALLVARVRSVSARHAVWTAVLAAMLLLPFLTPLLPPIPVPVLRSAPVVMTPPPVPQPPVSGLAAARGFTPEPAFDGRTPAPPRLTWQQFGLALYLVVALALLTRLLVSYLVVKRLVRSSGQVRDGSARNLLDGLAGPGAPALRESASIAVPVTAGSFRPSILLPSDWREWSREKLAAALAHELAHVRRKDSLIALVAALNKAAFWFHPLAWWLERKLALLAEEASDDCSLLVLGDRRRYASTLVEMTEAARGGRERIFWQAIAMARPSTLRRRIDRVLDESRRIHGGLSRGRWIVLSLVSAVMLCGAAALQLQPVPRPVLVGAAPPNNDQREARLRAELESPYREWLNEEVVYIIPAEESAAFTQLSSDQQRENFIEQFWLRRDPTPGTITNEFEVEHDRRIAYANARFASKLPGWKTDRGRIYITFGPPDEIESHPSGGAYNRPLDEGGGSTSTFPFEIWRYRYIEGIGTDIRIEFVDKTMSGEYRMTIDPTEKDALLTASKAGLALVDGNGNLSQSSPLNPPAAANLGATGDTLPMQVRLDYTPSNDSTALAHLTLTFFSKDLQSQLANDAEVPRVIIYGRLTNLSRRVIQTFEDATSLVAQPSGSPGAGGVAYTYQKTIALSPATYRLNIVVKDVASGRIANRELSITVPAGE
jgi:GWxTD domain-containing protein